MPTPPASPHAEPSSADLALASTLGANGLAVADDHPLGALAPLLQREAERLAFGGGFRHAGVGRGATFQVRPEIRNDRVHWLDPARPTRAQRRLLEGVEALRRTLNRELTLGLFGFEAHLACYPAGAFYRTHLDRFRSASHRVLTLLLYLNPNPVWDAADGGALRVYLEEPEREPWREIAPLGGRLVLFESGRFHHEVLPARRTRWSLVGWLTARP